MPSNVRFKSGFTLAELLISLAILGVIATFTIPKILVAQQNSANAAKAKEVAAMVAGAYDAYRQDNVNTTSTTIGALTQYMNYVAVDNSSSLDDHLNANVNYSCGTNVNCLKMHGGGTFFYSAARSFGGSNNTNGIFFFYDPDSQRTGIVGDGPGKSVCFYLYYNGRITTRANVLPGTADSTGGPFNPGAYDPSWFTWN